MASAPQPWLGGRRAHRGWICARRSARGAGRSGMNDERPAAGGRQALREVWCQNDPGTSELARHRAASCSSPSGRIYGLERLYGAANTIGLLKLSTLVSQDPAVGCESGCAFPTDSRGFGEHPRSDERYTTGPRFHTCERLHPQPWSRPVRSHEYRGPRKRAQCGQ